MVIQFDWYIWFWLYYFKECVIVRRDIFEVIQPEPNKTIKLNECNVLGFTYVEEKKKIMLDGKEIEISLDSYNEFKKQFS